MERLRRLVVPLAVLAAALALASGPLSRFGIWPFRIGFIALAVGVLSATLAATFSLLLLVWPKARAGQGVKWALVALTGVAVATFPLTLARRARALPLIHDITTDTDNPPMFVDLLSQRAGAPNDVTYGGIDVAALQKRAYPDIAPITSTLSVAESHAKALRALQTLGLKIAAEKAAEGRIEATATTFWFGFVDDVVIRIVPEGTGSRIDIRSLSRVGRSDVGANAARVRALTALIAS